MQISIASLNAKYLTSKTPLYAGLSVVFPDEKITAIFGPNGVGKSTLLRVIARLEDSLVSNGKLATQWADPGGFLSYVPQGYAASLMPWMTIEDNLTLPVSVCGNLGQEELANRGNSLKSRFGISYTAKYPTNLSGGQQQTVVLLRALVRKPDFLLLDEPFSALDVYSGLHFRETYIQYLQEHSIAAAFVTHDLRECVRFSDRIVFLGKEQSGATAVKMVKEFSDTHRHDVKSPIYLDPLVSSLAELTL